MLFVIFIIVASLLTIKGACALSGSASTEHSNESISMQSEPKSTSNSASVLNKMTIKEHFEMYWKFFFEKGEKTPEELLPQQKLDLAELFTGGGNDLKAAWLGHSSLLINIDGYSILTDPIFESKVSLVGPTRFNKKLPLDIEELHAVDVVIISHDHYDHLNKHSVQQLSRKAGLFIVPLRVGKLLVKWGIPEKKIVELNWWEEFHLDSKLIIAATPSQHFSGRGLFDKNITLWASWVIKTDNHSIFFSGDSGYFGGFKEIEKKYGPFDVTFLECGAYNQQWSNIHMFPEQTVQAFLDLGGNILQPVHWATFNLALHAWYEPIERLTNAAFEKGSSLSIPLMGQVVNYQKSVTANPWWRPVMEKSHNKINQQQLLTSSNQ